MAHHSLQDASRKMRTASKTSSALNQSFCRLFHFFSHAQQYKRLAFYSAKGNEMQLYDRKACLSRNPPCVENCAADTGNCRDCLLKNSYNAARSLMASASVSGCVKSWSSKRSPSFVLVALNRLKMEFCLYLPSDIQVFQGLFVCFKTDC